MLNPQAEALESHLGLRLPGSLVDLYRDSHLVTQADLRVLKPSQSGKGDRLQIEGFLPLDSAAVMKFSERVFGRVVPFARDRWGNVYCVALSDAPAEDGAVTFFSFDPWREEKVSDSLRQFLEIIRDAASVREKSRTNAVAS